MHTRTQHARIKHTHSTHTRTHRARIKHARTRHVCTRSGTGRRYLSHSATSRPPPSPTPSSTPTSSAPMTPPLSLSPAASLHVSYSLPCVYPVAAEATERDFCLDYQVVMDCIQDLNGITKFIMGRGGVRAPTAGSNGCWDVEGRSCRAFVTSKNLLR